MLHKKPFAQASLSETKTKRETADEGRNKSLTFLRRWCYFTDRSVAIMLDPQGPGQSLWFNRAEADK
jgi:hypothetical protein